MAFKLIFSEEALFQLKKLDNQIVSRLLEKLESTVDNPTRFFERLAGRDEYKLRIGDYRIIARILQDDNAIFIMALGHRKNIYK